MDSNRIAANWITVRKDTIICSVVVPSFLNERNYKSVNWCLKPPNIKLICPLLFTTRGFKMRQADAMQADMRYSENPCRHDRVLVTPCASHPIGSSSCM